MMKRLLTIATLFGLTSVANGQNITGHVYGASPDGKEALAGAYVIWAGTSHGTITSPDGEYDLQMIDGKARKLVVSYVGYTSDTLTISTQGKYDVTLSPIEMTDVEVTARRIGSAIDRLSPMLTQNVTADELSKAACCNLGESFQTNASVDVNYADAATGAKTIQLLGLQGRYVQMMSENVPSLRGIASPYGLSYVPGPWMNGIQISKGVGTVVNGYEAITGQINIDYKKPVGTNEVASLNVYGSNAGRMEANASLNLKVGPQVRTNIMLNMVNDLMDMDENNDGFRDEPRVRQLNLFNRWYRHTDFYTFDLAVKTLNERRLGGQKDFDSTHPDGEHYGVFIRTDRVETWMKNGFVFSPEFSIGFPIGYTYHHQGSFFGDREYKGTQHSYNFNSIANWNNGGRHEFHAGISSQGDFYNETANYGKGATDFDRNDISFGVYGQYTFRHEDILSIIAGVRVDHHNHYGTFVTPRLHVRYAPNELTTIRLAAGKGYRGASILSENNYLLTSKREWTLDNNYGQEKAWNMGLSITQYVNIGSRQLTLNAEFYHTEFERQMVTDMDISPRLLHAYFATSRGYANNFQIEGRIEPVRGLELTAAWRWNDNELRLNDQMQRRPLTSRYKSLVALSYQTPLKTWQFDANMQINGGGRIPTTSGNPDKYARATTFGSYQMYNAQITKWFRRWSVYAGCENIGNFMQEDPIISADDPQSNYFDSSLIWGPLMSRRFYVGLRWHFDKFD